MHIRVTAGGKSYEEMHVDGGPTRQVIFTPAAFDSVGDSALVIAERSLETLTKSQGIGDLLRMYAQARVEGVDFNLAHIPADFSAPRPPPGLHARHL